MMRAILSNDDEDWHSHLEQSVKESGLDWQAGFFMIGGMLKSGWSNAPRSRRDDRNHLIHKGFLEIQKIWGPIKFRTTAAGSDRVPATRNPANLFLFWRECAALFHSRLQYRDAADATCFI
ncbi:hypothetical protein [Burkholderia diffusa]|uniref:hypothetical protein n=1 Tax=Burkholderia diffusa TaxID=488732 RepID=UPI00157B919C|nr:hypothetical protein [Burkholderia diffusa]NTY39247.1 hypothetical protein [Burkholderia diffusa]